MKFSLIKSHIKDYVVAGSFVVLLGLLIWVSIWAYKTYMKSPPYVDKTKYPISGIDVSAHNGDIDFEKLRQAGIDFVFVKATEGTDFTDRNFVHNFRMARAAGLRTGAYHYFRFDSDGVDQALNLMKALGSRKPDMGIVIDVEKAGNPDTVPLDTIRRRLFHMVDYLNLLGHRVMFYTNLDGYYEYLAEDYPGFPLWICGFHENPINAEWTFWQFDHHGKLPGIEGDVDLNVFCGNADEWNEFLNGALYPYTAPPDRVDSQETLAG